MIVCYRLERCLEEVVRKQVPSQVEEIVHDVDLPLFGLPVSQDGLGLRCPRMHGHDQGQTDEGRDEGGRQEVDHGTEGDHAVHLGVQARGTWVNKRI